MRIQTEADLTPYSFFRTAALAARIFFPQTKDDLKSLANDLSGKKQAYILGNGSNVLFAKEYYEDDFICMKEYLGIREEERGIRFAAGEKLSQLISYFRKENMGGAEFLAMIPGLIGGAVMMNAGAYGHEFSSLIISLRLFDMSRSTMRELAAQDLKWSYRKQHFVAPNEIVESVLLAKSAENFDVEKMQRIQTLRKSKFPKHHNCGSVFKNPDNAFAGQLIEEAGLKGVSIGGARVSYEHANIIENFDHATGHDIAELITKIKEVVLSKTGILLNEELCRV